MTTNDEREQAVTRSTETACAVCGDRIAWFWVAGRWVHHDLNTRDHDAQPAPAQEPTVKWIPNLIYRPFRYKENGELEYLTADIANAQAQRIATLTEERDRARWAEQALRTAGDSLKARAEAAEAKLTALEADMDIWRDWKRVALDAQQVSDRWRDRAEVAETKLTALEAEIQVLRPCETCGFMVWECWICFEDGPLPDDAWQTGYFHPKHEHEIVCLFCHVRSDAQRIATLEAEVHEWLCTSCRTVYPGPPADGVSAVICPKCGGTTAPRLTVELKAAEAKLTALTEEITSLKLAGQSITDFNHRLTAGNLDLQAQVEALAADNADLIDQNILWSQWMAEVQAVKGLLHERQPGKM